MYDSDNTALYAFRKYGDVILRCAYACTGCFSEAEDITQDVFLSMHAESPIFSDDEHMKAWLLKVTINKCKNLKKSFRFSRTQSIDEKIESELSCEFTGEENEIREILFRLPEKYSTVLYLYYYEGYNIREIAQMMSKNENTVSSLLQRGRKKLKIELEREGYYARG